MHPDGSPSRLADGQLFRLDGTHIKAYDAATLKNGRVIVQKDGTTFTLKVHLPITVMGMCNGDRVQEDGIIKHHNGSITVLREGQTVLIEGIAATR